MNKLMRRGFSLGETKENDQKTIDPSRAWEKGMPVYLPAAIKPILADYSENIVEANSLYKALLDQQECDDLLDQALYITRLQTNFESLGSSMNEGDDQEIETVLFDALENEDIVAEDLWIKVSWLSFYEQDASLRFRFSFGMDHVEDVAADKQRQHYAALLCDAVFPESRIITDNQDLQKKLKKIIDSEELNFVERIVYFNSPQGGAYLHHDLERGHAGVVYAQLSGTTYWLALPKYQLLDELKLFIEQCKNSHWPETLTKQMRDELSAFTKDELAQALETFSNTTLIHCMNETEEFVQQLISHGHGQQINEGDAILLPQENLSNCCWHSVFCLGEETGQALSFAIRL